MKGLRIDLFQIFVWIGFVLAPLLMLIFYLGIFDVPFLNSAGLLSLGITFVVIAVSVVIFYFLSKYITTLILYLMDYKKVLAVYDSSFRNAEDITKNKFDNVDIACVRIEKHKIRVYVSEKKEKIKSVSSREISELA